MFVRGVVMRSDCDFFALDVETANPDRSSVCAIGLVGFIDGRAAIRWESLINPKTYFHPYCTFIHGITEEMVVDAPELSSVLDSVGPALQGKIVAAHSPFDQGAVRDYCRRNGRQEPDWRWLDTVRVARRAWPHLKKQGGYGLPNLCEKLSINLNHHDALSDAEACGQILLKACAEKSVPLEEWPTASRRPLSGQWPDSSRYCREGSSGGPLTGEVVCFTGTLESMRRMDAADRVCELGAKVTDSLTRKVTVLVLGKQVVLSYRGQKVSNKMKQAYERVRKGEFLQIVTEQDFLRLVGGFTE